MPRRRSLSERLARAKSPEARAKVLADWLSQWEKDQEGYLNRLYLAFQANDAEAVRIVTEEMKARLTALEQLF